MRRATAHRPRAEDGPATIDLPEGRASGHATAGAPGGEDTPARGRSLPQTALLQRLARVEGQVRGVARMVEEDRDCLDILQQITAVQAALDAVALRVVERHVQRRVLTGGREARGERAQEVLAAIARLMRRR